MDKGKSKETAIDIDDNVDDITSKFRHERQPLIKLLRDTVRDTCENNRGAPSARRLRAIINTADVIEDINKKEYDELHGKREEYAFERYSRFFARLRQCVNRVPQLSVEPPKEAEYGKDLRSLNRKMRTHMLAVAHGSRAGWRRRRRRQYKK